MMSWEQPCKFLIGLWSCQRHLNLINLLTTPDLFPLCRRVSSCLSPSSCEGLAISFLIVLKLFPSQVFLLIFPRLTLHNFSVLLPCPVTQSFGILQSCSPFFSFPMQIPSVLVTSCSGIFPKVHFLLTTTSYTCLSLIHMPWLGLLLSKIFFLISSKKQLLEAMLAGLRFSCLFCCQSAVLFWASNFLLDAFCLLPFEDLVK